MDASRTIRSSQAASAAARALLILAALAVAAGGCRSFTTESPMVKAIVPSNFRNWSPEMARLAYAEFLGETVRVHNIRNCTWVNATDFILDHYDKTLDLREVQTVDFLMIPFKDTPQIAHTMLSFGFRDGYHLVLSVEIRKEDGEKYGALKGFFNQYEIMYVLGDERDVIMQCTNYRHDDVYLYRGRATPEMARRLLVDVLRRANKLVDSPEFYNTLTNNCTTNLVGHVNRMSPGKIPYSVEVLLPGLSDKLAYDLDLIERHGAFEETRRRAHINAAANAFTGGDDASFSAAIRVGR